MAMSPNYRAKRAWREDDIPDFLKVENRNKPIKKKRPRASATVTPAKAELPPLPAALRWADDTGGEGGFQIDEGVVPRRWADYPDTIRMIWERLTTVAERREVHKEAFVTMIKEKRAAAPKKPTFGGDLFIIEVLRNRKLDTKAGKRFAAMVEYMKANPKASVADVIANTGWKFADYKWALENKYIKVNTTTLGA